MPKGNKPDYFVCLAETTEDDRKKKRPSHPVRIAGAWIGEKGQISCGRFKLNALITRNTQVVLFPNVDNELAEPEGGDEDTPF